ncbi:MAG: lipopolysaccharide assembly protein LapA domain-containing protein [Bdellovibrionales bacterium]|jgi:uncharacterized integral membrane protein
MRIFSGILGIIVLLLVLSFASRNNQEVSVALWPFKDTMLMPLYAVGLVPLAFGFFFGSFWGWITGLSHRLHARRLNKELTALKRDLGNAAKVKTKTSFWSRP